MGRLDGKVAIITGGAGGIGVAAGQLFVGEGARVLLVDLGEKPLQQAVQRIGSEAVSYAVADVTQPEQVQRYVRTAVERFVFIDVFANTDIYDGLVQATIAY